jgi:hypothetical protein
METTPTRASDPLAQLLPGFTPLSALWDGEGAPFPSEDSARWVLRNARQALMEVEALAMLRGRIYVHRERFAQVIRQRALNACRVRHAPAA